MIARSVTLGNVPKRMQMNNLQEFVVDLTTLCPTLYDEARLTFRREPDIDRILRFYLIKLTIVLTLGSTNRDWSMNARFPDNQ